MLRFKTRQDDSYMYMNKLNFDHENLINSFFVVIFNKTGHSRMDVIAYWIVVLR